MKKLYFIFFVCLLVFIGCSETQEATEQKLEFKDIYNHDADAHADITSAIITAQNENKRVLLMFGANWCPWCQRLHHTFATDKNVHKALTENYELVMVDLGRRDHNMDVDSEYGEPNKLGLPALVVLDQDGTMLIQQETGSLEYPQGDEKKGHDPEKVIAFLHEWKTPSENN